MDNKRENYINAVRFIAIKYLNKRIHKIDGKIDENEIEKILPYHEVSNDLTGNKITDHRLLVDKFLEKKNKETK